MAITASMVKELRERTGVGMMDCKKALAEADGDIEQAIEAMRKSGMAKAAKKSGRIAAEGVIHIDTSGDNTVMLEVNCETDFVAKDENFLAFVKTLAEQIASKKPADIVALMAHTVDGATLEEARQQLVSKIGENVTVRRFVSEAWRGTVGGYLHGSRIGVVVELEGGNEAIAKDVAMHIAGTPTPPVCVNPDDIPQELLDKEKEIFIAQAQESGKPAEIIEKMIGGKLNKYKKEVTLIEQPFIKDPDQTIAQLLKSAHATIIRFYRYQVGEGIEKKQDNFVDEVMAQAKGE